MARKQAINVDKEYLKAYYANEADANKQMSFANALGAILMLGLWICYLTGFFHAHDQIKIILHIIFPVGILILLTPLLYVFRFKHILQKPNYKYFVVFSFIFVIAVLNTVLPRNSIIAWALCLFVTNHYYNPKLGRIVFVVTLGLMLTCLYASLFVGEYDATLMGAKAIENGEVVPVFGIVERYEFFKESLANGNNVYLEALIVNYLPRALLAALIFVVCNSLNIRTYKLLRDEIHVNSEQQKTRTELEVAKEIQLNTLPNEITTSEDIEIVAELKAAKEVGGDFYDYFNIDNDHIAILIGDVSGKGIPAAMFMMKSITCFKNFVRKGKTPSEILKEVNASIYDPNSQMFVTCFLAILDKTNGKLVFANAGHNPPVIGKDKHYRFLKCQTGFVLGGLEEAIVQDEEAHLEPGESLTLYTDGITEARNEKGEFFGDHRLIKSFNKREYTCLVELHRSLKDDVMVFAGDAPQSDDLTFITIKYHGDHYSYKEMQVDATMDNIKGMLEFVEKFCDKYQFPDSFKKNILVVADEIYSNIVKYGYEYQGGPLYVRQLYNIDRQEYVLTVVDKANAFNPLEVNESKVNEDANKQKVGGLGILIIKNIMSEAAYDRINGKNILVLKKNFKK